MVSCPSSMVSAVCVVPFPPHAGGFLTLSISTTKPNPVQYSTLYRFSQTLSEQADPVRVPRES